MPNIQSLTPQALRLLSKEVVSLRNDPPEGVRVVVDEEDLTAMEGWVQGPCKCSLAFEVFGLEDVTRVECSASMTEPDIGLWNWQGQSDPRSRASLRIGEAAILDFTSRRKGENASPTDGLVCPVGLIGT
jgi:hypothetical protein